MSQTDFDQLKAAVGGILSFNNFLTTNPNRAISIKFAKHAIRQPGLIGVLFVMQITPSVSTTPFANVKDVNYYHSEDKILFSIQSLFRIVSIQRIEEEDRLWQVNLTFTSDTDPELERLMKTMEKDMPQAGGWFSLGDLLIQLAQFDETQQIYEMILNRTDDEKSRGNIYHQLGLIKYYQGEQSNAFSYSVKALKIRQRVLPVLAVAHFRLFQLFSNIFVIFHLMIVDGHRTHRSFLRILQIFDHSAFVLMANFHKFPLQ